MASRPLRAVVLALLLSLIAIAGAGFATDGRDDKAAPLVLQSFGVPVSRVGDIGMYARLLDPGTGQTAAPDGGDAYTYRFEWLPDGEMFDTWGGHHWTNDLRFQRNEMHAAGPWINKTWTMHYDQASRALVAHTEHESDGDTRTEPVPTPQRTVVTAYNTTRFSTDRADGLARMPFCGLVTPLQGTAHAIAEDWELSCESVGRRVSNAPGVYSFKRAAESDGQVFAEYTFTRFAAGPGGQVFEAWHHHVTSMLFRDDIPYPVRITYAPGGDETVTVVLASFVPGDGPPLGTAASTGRDLPSVVRVPTPPWGLDDTDVDHPFLLSEAYQQALSDPMNHSLREFLRDHPDAYVSESRYSEFRSETWLERRWAIEVTDGHDQVTVCPSRSHTGVLMNDESGLAGPGPLPLGRGDALWGCRLDEHHEDLNAVGYEPSDRPSVASLMAIWQGLTPLYGLPEPVAYGFHSSFFPDVELYESIRLSGFRLRDSDLDGVGTIIPGHERESASWQLWVHPDGRLDRLSQGSHHQRTERPTDAPRSGDSAPALAPSGQTVQPFAPIWTLPGATQVGLAGSLAVATALLYWLWPWTKPLVTPLFSRIDRPRALRHPKRLEMLAIVESEPGIHLEEVRRRMGLATGAFRHHLEKLEANGLLVVARGKGFVSLFAAGAPAEVVHDAARSETAKAILARLRSTPTASPTEIARELSLSRQVVHYHMKRMRRAGLIPA